MKKLFLILIIFNLFCHFSFAQKHGQELIDSLLKELSKTKYDTSKVNLLNDLSYQFQKIKKCDNGLQYGNQAFVLSKKNKFKLGEAEALYNIGVNYSGNNNYDKALENYIASLNIYKELDDKNQIASNLREIGFIYSNMGNYDKALENYFASLKIYEQLNEFKEASGCYNNIGIIYWRRLDYDKALENHFISLKIRKKIDYKRGIADSYSNIGINYNEKGNYDNALENHFAALKIYQEIGYDIGVANCFNNLGIVYSRKHELNMALENYFNALKIYQKIDQKIGVAYCYDNIASIYLKQHKAKEAKSNSLLSLIIFQELDFKEDIKTNYLNLSKIDSALGSWESAYEYHKLFKNYNDSIFNEVSEKNISEMSAKYESEKKEVEIKLLEKDKENQSIVSAEESKRHKNILFSITSGLFLVIVFSIFMVNRWKVTQNQKNIIANQKNIVEAKNKEITDSISYALRIQTAILPPQKIMKKYLENSFILYKPKDIVAGDFYWMETVNDLVLIAACDCTGHGVPGAMVSVVCHNALNRAVREFGLTQPAKILDKTSEIVIENFSKSEEDIKDGMDISLCAYNIKTKKLEWSGANNPLWLLQNGQLIETKADKQPIGMSEDNRQFTNHQFDLNTGDSIYLFTDGFADQFGGELGEKKLTRKRFKEQILLIQDKSMQEQGVALDKFIVEYRKAVEQIDDILVMGVKV